MLDSCFELVRQWVSVGRQTEAPMAMKINGGRRNDDRIERILTDPAGYFAEARRKARDEVAREMAKEGRRPRRGIAAT